MNAAGAQLESTSIAEAIGIVKQTLDTMIQEGAV